MVIPLFWVGLLGVCLLAIYFSKFFLVKPISQLNFSEVLVKTPEIKAYTDNGYELLTVISESQGYLLEPIKFGVYNYSDKGDLNPFPLFRIDNPFRIDRSSSLFDIYPKFHFEEGQASSNYTKNVPVKVKIDYFADPIKASYSDELVSFLEVSMKKDICMKVRQRPNFDDNFCVVNSPLLAENQRYEWKYGKTLEVKETSNTLLAIISPSIYWIIKLDRLFYVLVHPEMPKDLVIPFIHLKLTDANWGRLG
jgi:hypothetical protein